MFSGTFLLIFGVATIVFQLWDQAAEEAPISQPQPQPQQMSASPQGFKASTHYVGVELVMVGAVLQITGFLGPSISKRATRKSGDEDRVSGHNGH